MIQSPQLASKQALLIATQRHGHAVLALTAFVVKSFHRVLARCGSLSSHHMDDFNAATQEDRLARNPFHFPGIRDVQLAPPGVGQSNPYCCMPAPCTKTSPKLSPFSRSTFSLSSSHEISGFESRPSPSATDPVRRG